MELTLLTESTGEHVVMNLGTKNSKSVVTLRQFDNNRRAELSSY